jgi:predicted nuclease of predicted toxin-antitoxin system
MRFLIDADLPRSIASVISDAGHDALDVRDIGLGGASDAEIAGRARSEGLCLITGDWGFADIRAYPPADSPGIIVLGLPDGATSDQIVAIANSLFHQPHLVSQVSGRLTIVERGRIRFRPPV